MRTSSLGFLIDDETELLRISRDFAAVTHNHPEGIKGAQATAYAIYLARIGSTKEEIKNRLQTWFAYDLSLTLDADPPNSTCSMYPARERYHQRSLLSSNRMTLKMPSQSSIARRRCGYPGLHHRFDRGSILWHGP